MMFVVSEQDAAAIRAAYIEGGELSAVPELRRLFPGITDNAKAREYARTIASWPPLFVIRNKQGSNQHLSDPARPASNPGPIPQSPVAASRDAMLKVPRIAAERQRVPGLNLLMRTLMFLVWFIGAAVMSFLS